MNLKIKSIFIQTNVFEFKFKKNTFDGDLVKKTNLNRKTNV